MYPMVFLLAPVVAGALGVVLEDMMPPFKNGKWNAPLFLYGDLQTRLVPPDFLGAYRNELWSPAWPEPPASRVHFARRGACRARRSTLAGHSPSSPDVSNLPFLISVFRRCRRGPLRTMNLVNQLHGGRVAAAFGRLLCLGLKLPRALLQHIDE